MLNANQLHDYRKIKLNEQGVLPRMDGAKLSAVGDAELESKEIEKCRQNLFDSLKTKRVNRGKDLCKAEYDDESKTITLTKKYGKLYRHMGYKGPNGAIMLYPEEAVFLLDAGALELSFKESPLSLEEAIAFVLAPNVSWSQYIVYSQLSRAGFIVVRHKKSCTATNIETEPISIPSSSTSCSDELRSPPMKQGRYMDSNFAQCSANTTRNLLLPSFEPSDLPSSSKIDDIPPEDLKLSKWNFNEIIIPDSCGSPVTKLKTPNFDCLPVLIEYNETRRVYDSRFFSLKSNRILPYKELLRRREFYRPKDWTFVDVRKILSWKEFKDKKYPKIRQPRKERIHGDIAPLLNGDEDESAIWRKLQIIKPITSFEHTFNSRRSDFREFQIVYDVHLSNAGFCLSLPTKPDRRLVIMKVENQPPKDTELKLLERNLACNDDVPICFAVVDNGEILYFNIDLIVTPDLIDA